MLARDFVPLLAKGTTVIATVSDSGENSSEDRDYGKLVARTAPGIPDYRHWRGLIPVEIVLMEDLGLSVRVHGSRRFSSCRCRIPYLEAEARSLNHALSIIVRHFEPSRISAVGNAFKAVYVETENEKWRRLDELAPG